MLALADPEAGPGDRDGPVKAVFRLSSTGLKTQRDDWLWAADVKELSKRVNFLIQQYDSVRHNKLKQETSEIKWDAELDRHLKNNTSFCFDNEFIQIAKFRPFVERFLYRDYRLIGRPYRTQFFYPKDEQNHTIAICGMANEHDFAAQATSRLFDKGLLKTGNGNTFGVARYRYTKSGERVDNVTDWAVQQFCGHYGALADGNAIGKDDIFAYVYAALHDPVWRETYAADLRRSFPRIPFHAEFVKWRDWGQRLLDLHIGYEQVEPWGLQRVDVPTDPSRKREGSSVSAVKLKLKSDPDNGAILVDSLTTLKGVPRAAWDYRLGNRSAIDWVLDQHKEKTPRDPTVAAKFNTYRFAEHKDKMIDLLDRVVRVSVETVAITDAMRAVQGPPEN
jgi:predicted helicase